MTTWAAARSMKAPAATGATKRVRRSRCCNSPPQPASNPWWPVRVRPRPKS